MNNEQRNHEQESPESRQADAVPPAAGDAAQAASTQSPDRSASGEAQGGTSESTPAGGWWVRVIGPDELHGHATGLSALLHANALNKMFLKMREGRENDPNLPFMMAVVVEGER